MNNNLYEPGPENWTYADLNRPSADCDVPDPSEVTLGSGNWHTCSHCGVEFILIVNSSTDSTRNFWVNYAQHVLMWEHVDRYENTSLRDERGYGPGIEMQ